MAARSFYLVLVTAPDLKSARVLARVGVSKRLAACANLVPKIESLYWWKGKVESAGEVLILFKTTERRLPALERVILAKHPYDTAEFIALPIVRGTRRYLEWVRQATT